MNISVPVSSRDSGASGILQSLPSGAEVLIIRLRSLGDMVLLTPAIAALRGWRPDFRLTVLSEPAFSSVWEGNPDVSGVILRRGFWATARELRSRRFAVTFNQHGGPTSALLTAAAASPARVCWPGRQFSSIYNVKVPNPSEYLSNTDYHTVEERMVQFWAAGLPLGPIPRARVYAQPDAEFSVRRKLRERGLSEAWRYAVIHPAANFETKLWSFEGFARTARWLMDEHGLVPVVILGSADRRLGADVRRFFGPALILEDLSLRELIALMAGGSFFLGNDSGPAHLAAAAGLPVVVIFGSSDVRRWRPWKAESRVVKNQYPCQPCRGGRCEAYGEPRCIRSVTVEQVLEACRSLLGEGESSGGSASIAGGGD